MSPPLSNRTSTVTLPPVSHDYQPNVLSTSRRPWRKHVTPWERLASEKWEGEGTEDKPYIVGWMSDDPENPHTWSRPEKWFITMLAALMTLVVALTSSIYSGAIGSIEERFPNYSIDTYIAPLSTFVLGFALGPLIWAPASEVFGRRNVFIVTYALFTAFNAGLVGSMNIWTVIILRFFSGAFGSSPLTNAGGAISDVWDPDTLGKATAVFSVAPYLGPALGPIIGGFLGESASFRWVFALVAILTAIITVSVIIWYPETYSPVLLRQRAERLSKATGKVYRSEFEREAQIQIGPLVKKALLRPWQLLFVEPIVFLLSLYLAIIYGTLYMLFAAFPIVYQEQRGWSAGIGALPFLGPLVGFLAAVAFYVWYENPRYVALSKKHGGFAPPEARLPSALIGGILLPVGLFWFAWTSQKSVHWIVSIIATVPFGIGMVLVFLSVLVYLIDAYLIYAASVLAANSVLRSLFGAAFPLFTTQMYTTLGINWASTLVAFLALACAPLPFLFYRYGERIRMRCKYAKEAAKISGMMKERAEKQQQLEKQGQRGAESV